MQVILLERVEHLGAIGDEVTVKDGYARNFLLPKQKALRVTEANRKQMVGNAPRALAGGTRTKDAVAILDALEQYQPELAEAFQDCVPHFNTPAEKEAVLDAYSQCKNISIDYAIMEKATNVYVCLGNFSWSDLGSWSSIHEISHKNSDNNVVKGNALTYDTRNSIIRGSSPDKLILVQGLNGYLVGEFGNVIIVCEKDREDLFRRFVNDVKAIPNSNDYI